MMNQNVTLPGLFLCHHDPMRTPNEALQVTRAVSNSDTIGVATIVVRKQGKERSTSYKSREL